jgi:hypothetical protein
MEGDMKWRETMTGLALAGMALLACASDSATEPDDSGDAASNDQIPAVFKKFSSLVQISIEGDYVVLRSNGVPDHKSPYFATTDSRYEAYNGSNPQYMRNPNSIASQTLVLRIPLQPAATAPSATPLGPIGIAVNGVAIFNQYAGPNRPLTQEINSFDQYNGHPQQTGVYHYHVEPLYLTVTRGSSALVGFLLDGFPVYGPIENGRRIVNSDLDSLHGHSGVTADYPAGIYHYHITSEDPYINGAGFYGRPGTVSQ